MKKSKEVVKVRHNRSRFGEIAHHLSKNRGAMIGLGIILVLCLIAATADLWISYSDDVVAQHITQRLQKPSGRHLMGTDQFGRDIFYRLLYATRYSISIGFIAVCVSFVLGLIFGSLAGYYVGKPIDNIIMRILDIFHSVPTILLGVVLVNLTGASVFTLMLAVGLVAMPGMAKNVRAAVLTTCNCDYVESARAIGLPEWRIVFFHVLPNCLSTIIVQFTLRIGNAIITASSLSFLGLGVPQPAPEWGSMLSAGRQYLRNSSYMTLFPGLAILITVLAFNMVGDGVRDALDPKLKR
ncbi:MAG: ABC transporter permease [Spirochaetales bacterium]|nr:ABC transporter permease [Spirochaetales bacterium]